MRRSTLAALTLAITAAALAACGQRQSLYLDSGRAESAERQARPQPAGPPPRQATAPASPGTARRD